MKVQQASTCVRGGAERRKDGSLWVRRSYGARQKGRVFVYCEVVIERDFPPPATFSLGPLPPSPPPQN